MSDFPNGLEITKTKVTPFNSGKTLGFATITFNEGFLVSGIRIIDGNKGPFISMPSKKKSNSNEYQDICYPISKELRDYMTSVVLDEYEKVKNENPSTRNSSSPRPNNTQSGYQNNNSGSNNNRYSNNRNSNYTPPTNPRDKAAGNFKGSNNERNEF